MELDARGKFIQLLRELRIAAGSPTQAALIRHKPGELKSTDVSDLLAGKGPTLPPWERVKAFVLACVRVGNAQGRTMGPEADVVAQWRMRHDALAVALDLAPPTHRSDDVGVVPLATRPIPQQLPAAPSGFTGRTAELTQLNATLDRAAAEMVTVVSALAGAGGIGKTWLALTWAHRHLDCFPDGQLFVDLHGFSPVGEPTTSGTAVRGFLDALGVAPGRIPLDLDAQAALYRSLVAGRRMLIVLDNAATADQVVPVLPGSPTCTVLVTGRHRLASLIDRQGAHHLALGVVPRDEARTLLIARIGTDRAAAEPDAVDELVDLCKGYPLALSITARNAATRPAVPLAEIVAELRELGLEMLDHDTDPAASLPAVLSWSLRRLTEEHRTVFGLLGIVPGPDATLPAVVSLTNMPLDRARKAISALEEASLVERRPHGRYAMHDLIRDYATRIARDLPSEVRETSLRRVLDFYTHTAHAADRLVNPQRPSAFLDLLGSGIHTQPLPDAPAAWAWFETEHASLLAAQRTAITHHWYPTIWHLAWELNTFHSWQGYRHDRLAVWQAAADAATHLRDPVVLSHAHQVVGLAHADLDDHEHALTHLQHALTLVEHHPDPVWQALVHDALNWVWAQRGDYRRALEHARRGLGLYQGLDLPTWEASALNAVGWCAAHLGDYSTGLRFCRAALSLYSRHHNPTGEAGALDSLGYIAHHTAQHTEAIDYYHRALTLYREHGHTYSSAGTLDGLGHPYTALGQHEQARTAWREALQLYQVQGRAPEAARVQRQLDGLDISGHDADQPPHDTETVNFRG